MTSRAFEALRRRYRDARTSFDAARTAVDAAVPFPDGDPTEEELVAWGDRHTAVCVEQSLTEKSLALHAAEDALLTAAREQLLAVAPRRQHEDIAFLFERARGHVVTRERLLQAALKVKVAVR